MVLEVQNNVAIAMALQTQGTSRTKHIDMKFHDVRELLSNGVINLRKVETTNQTSDIQTKPASKDMIGKFVNNYGLDSTV